jgi:UDP-N-acetylmuramoyl-tripeptide--D-alanyl-D-alanine ligase
MKRKTLWSSAEADIATGGRSTRQWKATGISIDTRTIERGDLYVAIKGPNFDGHDFAAEALNQGAAAVMASRKVDGAAGDRPVFMVDDSLAALNALARAARSRSLARIVAITGSVGKTGVKEALKLALSEQGATTASEGNLNNEIGVPLSLARMPADARYGVFELGMNRSGEISRLAQLVRPDVAVITTIAPAHTEFFDSVAEIADAKSEIFDGMMGGTAVLNRDNAYFATLAVTAFARSVDRIIGFGAHPEASSRVLDATPGAESSLVTADVLGQRIDYRVGLPGRHWVINSLAVLAAAAAVGADIGAAADAMSRLTAAKGRGRRHHVALSTGGIEVIDDSYNASPAAMRAAFDTLAAAEPGPGGRRIAVLGDMLELGEDSERLHAGLAAPLAARGIDLVFASGPSMKALHEALPEDMRGGYADSAEQTAPAIVATVRPGDVITVKGSLGSRMGCVVEALLEMNQAASPAQAVNG